MTSPIAELQKAAVAALLSDAGVLSIVATTSDGPAVFATGTFVDAYPRVTIQAPQRIPIRSSCGVAADMILTLHSWANGPDSSLVAGELADAVLAAFAAPLLLDGWRISSFGPQGSRSVGDPEPSIEHFVTDLRFTVHRAA